MERIKVGVFGAYRGSAMIQYCELSDHAEIVAVCDCWELALERQKALHPQSDIGWYTSFDDFLQHEMDAVVLANYATEHAPYAIRCLQAGKHVYSEVLPCQTLREAVELIEAVEQSGAVYAYGENFCYFPAVWEMKRLYKQGKIGEFEYGECEYVHNCEPIWHALTYGDPDHWRNRLYCTAYCTHSIGPILHATGLRPVSVVGFEGKRIERHLRTGSKSGAFGIEFVELENGGLLKSLHGGLYKNSIWYCMYGTKGRMETAREDAENYDIRMLYVNADRFSGQYGPEKIEAYKPQMPQAEKSLRFGHGGSDFYAIDFFIRRILGDAHADTIDVYEAVDMALCGIFAYRSILNGGTPMSIPDLRLKQNRELWRGDVACTDRRLAGDQLLPSFSRGDPEIPEDVYHRMKRKFQRELENRNGYTEAAFTQSSDQSGAHGFDRDIMMKEP